MKKESKLNESTITGRIRKFALEILEQHPQGLEYKDLRKEVLLCENFNPNTISGSLYNLNEKYSDLVYKPKTGLYRLLKYSEDTFIEKSSKKIIAEEKFYEPFAQWLVYELEECTNAIGLGGNYFKDKWGTPDVIGVRESRKSDIISFATEIITAEIKINSFELITSFGQACAYKLFSHKSYIVIPESSKTEDIARLDTLSRQLGIGLILFDSTNIETPNFQIRSRAVKHDPDMFYVNKYLKSIERKLFG